MNMVDNSLSPFQTPFGWFLVLRESSQAFFSSNEAPSACLCEHLHPSARNMRLHHHRVWMPLKHTSLARGTRTPRLSSIVEWFFLLPSPASVAGSVVPSTCPLARTAVRASPAGSGEDVQSDNRPATTPDGPSGVETAETWPRSGEQGQRHHGGRSD